MGNKHIELVKRWLADSQSVTKAELKANTEAAYAVWHCSEVSYASDPAWWAARTAYCAAESAAESADLAALYWVSRYEELTGGE